MIRATTPTHKFKFPTDPSQYSKILISYSQLESIILEKKKTDMTFDSVNKTGQYTLTQSETKLFDTHYPVFVQARVLTSTGEALASKTIKMKVSDVLNEEVL